MRKPLVAESCIALLVLLFTYTAISKLLDYHKFVFQMGLAPVPMMKLMAPVLGWLMPLIEGLIVVGLIVSKFRISALYATFILFILFETYISYMLLSGLHLPCTCGGLISSMSWKTHLMFNAAFILITITAIIQTKQNDESGMVPAGL